MACVWYAKVDGCVFAIYNVGMMDHAVGDQQHRISDGLYHVVRFVRDGPNSTLQIDDLPVQYKRPTGNTRSVSPFKGLRCQLVTLCHPGLT